MPHTINRKSLDRNTIVMLQRTAGNRAVQRLLAGQTTATYAENDSRPPLAEAVAQISHPAADLHAQTTPVQRQFAVPQEASTLPESSPPSRELGQVLPALSKSSEAVRRSVAYGAVQRGILGAIGTGLKYLGKFALRTVLGPFYKLYLYFRDRKTKPHKIAPNFTRYKAMLQNGGAGAVATFGQGGSLAAGLGMLSDSFLDELSGFCGWATLITTLLGLIPGAQPLLGVAAMLGTITAVTMLTRLGISSLLSSWSTIRAKLLWDKLPQQVDPASPDLQSYLAVAQQFQTSGMGVMKGSALIGASGLAAGMMTGGSLGSFNTGSATTAMLGKVSPNLNQGFSAGLNTMQHPGLGPSGSQVTGSAVQNGTTAGVLGVANMREYSERTGKATNAFTRKQGEADDLATHNQFALSSTLIPKSELPKPWSGAGFGGTVKAILGTIGAVLNPLNILIGTLYTVYKIFSGVRSALGAIWSGIKSLVSKFSKWRAKKSQAQPGPSAMLPEEDNDPGNEDAVLSIAALAEVDPIAQMDQGSLQAIEVMEEAGDQLEILREMAAH